MTNEEASSIDDPQTPHEAARLLAHAGYHVVPIREGGKHPPIADWWNNATTNPATVDAWWGGLYKTAGVGIAMGYDNIFALDVDVGDGKNGDETLRDLELAYHDLPETIEQQTGSGGRHLLYRAPPGVEIRNDAGRRLGPGLDIRGAGGQIVCAPTTHPNGKPYVWLLASAPWEREPADAPGWLIGLLTQEEKPWIDDGRAATSSSQPLAASTGSVGSGSSRDTSTAWSFGSSASDSDWQSTPTTRPGDRFNQQTTWDQILTADGWTRSTDGYSRHEQRWVRPGKLAKDGISATINANGTDRLRIFTTNAPNGLEEGESYDRWGYWVHTRYHGDFTAAARVIANIERAVPGIGERFNIATLIDEEWNSPAEAGPPTPSERPTRGTHLTGEQEHRRYDIHLPAGEAGAEDVHNSGPPGLFRWRIHWPDFWTREHADENWHLEPILARGRGHAIWAGAKTGKSYHVLPMALAIATGRAHLDKPPGTPEHVIYMDYEMTLDDLHDRLTEFGYHPDIDLEHLHYISLPSIPGLDTAQGAQCLIDAVSQIGATAVIIDTISRAVEGPENDADTIRAFYRHTGLALKELGVTWVRLDHGGKDPTKGQRGTSGKNDDVDIVWRLTRTDAGMRYEATHRRIAWVPEKVDVKVTEDDDGAIQFRTLNVPAEPPGTSDLVALLDRLGVPDDAGRTAARKALTTAGETAANRVLEAALRRRKAARNRRGQVPDDLIETGSTGSAGSLEKEQVRDRGQVDGQPRAGDPSVRAGSCPPHGGATAPAAPFNPFFDL